MGILKHIFFLIFLVFLFVYFLVVTGVNFTTRLTNSSTYAESNFEMLTNFMYLIGWVIFLVVTYVLYLRNNTKNKPTAPSQYDRPTYFEDTHTIPENRGPDDMNVSERKLFEALKRLGLDPVPQYPVDQCTLDFAFPEDHLAIEVNGPYHYTVEGKERDRRRKKFLHHTYPPWKVRSYRAEQVFANSDGVAREIKRILEKDRSP